MLDVNQASLSLWCPDLQGKTAIVTGAGRYHSIGRQIALELARQGVKIILTGTGRSAASFSMEEQEMGWRDTESVLDEVRGLGSDGMSVVLDVGDADAVSALLETVTQNFGGADFLINNAGAAVGKDRTPLHELAIEEWHRVMRVNLDGAFYMSRGVASHLMKQGRSGAIVNISSIASRQCLPNSGAYSASKLAMNAMSRTMALELAPHGIRVNAVLPGLVKTSRIALASTEQWDDFVRAYTPLGRAGDGTEIANMCTFLCSNRASWITGQEIAVDGGTSWR